MSGIIAHDNRRYLVLAPREAACSPTAACASVTVRIRIAFEALKNVVRIKPQSASALGNSDGANAAPA